MDDSQHQLETGLFARLRAWLFGYDVFISYKRTDGLGYALALENFLRAKDFSCFRDYRELPPSEDFPKLIDRALCRSQLLLVVGTPLAVDPVEGQWVRREIEGYLKRRSRAVVINVNNCVTRETWPGLQDKPWLAEQPDRLEPPAPSIAVLDAIAAENRFVGRNKLARWTAAAVTMAIAGLSIGAIWYQSRASENERISTAQQLAANANSLRLSRPAALQASVQQALEATRIHRSLITDEALRSALDLLPPLIADIQTSCDATVAAVDQSRRFLALGHLGRFCVVDLIERKLVFTKTFDELGPVVALTFNRQGLLIVVSTPLTSHASILSAYETTNWTEIQASRFDGQISQFVLSPDGQWLALGTDAGLVAIAPFRANHIPDFSEFINKMGTHQSISLLEFDDAGTHLLVGSKTALELWQGWSASTPKPVWHEQLTEADTPFLSRPPAFISSQRDLLVAAYRGVINIRRLSDLSQLQEIQLAEVNALALTSQGWIVAHTKDGQFSAWHRPVKPFVRADGMGYEENDLRGQLPFTGQLATSVDGEYVIGLHRQSGGTESWGSLLQIASGDEVARFAHQQYIRHFVSLGNGSFGATAGADARVRIWGNINALHGRTTHLAHIADGAALDSSGARAAIATSTGLPFQPGAVEIWALDQTKRMARAELPGAMYAMHLHDNPRQQLDIVTRDSFWVWKDWPETKPTKSFDLPSLDDDCKRAAAFASSADYVAVSAGRQKIFAGPAASLQMMSIPSLPNVCIEALAISPDGKTLAISSLSPRSPQITVLDTGTADVLMNVTNQYLVRSMAFDASGRFLAISTGIKPQSDHLNPMSGVEIWSVRDAKLHSSRNLFGEGIFEKVCLSSDGTMLGTTQGAVTQFWTHDVDSGELKLVATQPLGSPMRSCFITDDNRRAVVGNKFGLRGILLDSKDLEAAAAQALQFPVEERR